MADEPKTPILSTGEPSTLGTYRRYVAKLFGEDSKALVWLDAKIKEQGADEPVLTDERQMIQLLGHLHQEDDRNGR